MSSSLRKPIRSGISFRFEINNKPRRNGEYNILFRITENRLHKRIATEVNVQKQWWDSNKEEVKKSDPGSISKNVKLQSILNSARQIQHELNDVSAEKIYQALKSNKSPNQTACIFSYTEQVFLKDKPYNTTRNTITVINKIKAFTGKTTLRFDSIDTDFIRRFELYLRQDCGNNGNTVDTNLSKIKSITNHAVRSGFVDPGFNPFRLYKIKVSLPAIEKLDETEVDQIKQLQLPVNSLIWHVRNYWLFSFYAAGIRFSDFSCLKWGNVDKESTDKVFLRYRMSKNKKNHSVPLHKSAIEILRYYEHRKDENIEFIFPVLNDSIDVKNEIELINEISRKNALVNKYLKKISQLANISKNLTFHVARHSFANIARLKTGDVYGVSKTMNHSRLSVTEQYLDRMDSTAVDLTMDKMFGDIL